MKIVCDIPDRLIKKVKDHYVNPYEVDEICEAILNGTPLPEHHGDLIDRDKLKRTIVKDPRRALSLVDLADFVWLAPTIIEGSDSE